MTSKYSPLESYLRDLPPKKKTVTLSFDEIESIIGSKLPDSANELSWWEHETEGNHVNKRAWAKAGWRVGQVHLREKRVKFIRAPLTSSRCSFGSAAAAQSGATSGRRGAQSKGDSCSNIKSA